MLEVLSSCDCENNCANFSGEEKVYICCFPGAYFLEIRGKNKSQISSSNLKVIILAVRQMRDFAKSFHQVGHFVGLFVCGLL